MDHYQALLQKTYDRRIPLDAHWELTLRCNLDCVHCYATNRGGAGELSLTEIRLILDQLAAAGCLFLVFTGGEIFCREDLLEILLLARERRFAVRLFSNGTMIDRAAATRLAELALTGVEISLYAMTPAVHDRVTRVSGSHAATMAGIRNCLDAGVHTTVKSPLFRQNIAEFAALRDYAAGLGAQFKFDFALVPADTGEARMEEIGLTEDELCEFIRAHAVQPKATPRAPAGDEPLCGAGSCAMAINPFGEVYPCLGIRQSVGSLRQHSLAELWQAAALEKMHAAKYLDLQECTDCPLAAHCLRCSGVALAECGNVFGRSPSACTIAKATARAVASLAEEATQ